MWTITENSNFLCSLQPSIYLNFRLYVLHIWIQISNVPELLPFGIPITTAQVTLFEPLIKKKNCGPKFGWNRRNSMQKQVQIFDRFKIVSICNSEALSRVQQFSILKFHDRISKQVDISKALYPPVPSLYLPRVQCFSSEGPLASFPATSKISQTT